jgi:hypothetical protein
MLIQYRKIVFDRKTNEAEIRNFLYSLSSCRSLDKKNIRIKLI